MQAIQWEVWPRYKMRMEGEEGMALARLVATSCVKKTVKLGGMVSGGWFE